MAVSVVTTITREDKEGFTGSVMEDGPVGPLAPSFGGLSYLRFKTFKFVPRFYWSVRSNQ